jgi:carbonic anhydrase
VAELKVRDIIVCGHSECGAMNALLNGVEKIALPNLKSWVASARPALTRCQAGETINGGLSDLNRLSQINVVEQAAHLMTYPLVQEACALGRLSVHAWWFNIAEGEVLAFDAFEEKFVTVGQWAKKIAARGRAW